MVAQKHLGKYCKMIYQTITMIASLKHDTNMKVKMYLELKQQHTVYLNLFGTLEL